MAITRVVVLRWVGWDRCLDRVNVAGTTTLAAPVTFMYAYVPIMVLQPICSYICCNYAGVKDVPSHARGNIRAVTWPS